MDKACWSLCKRKTDAEMLSLRLKGGCQVCWTGPLDKKCHERPRWSPTCWCRCMCFPFSWSELVGLTLSFSADCWVFP
eukprot:1153720-Pelagomonas_calceolata.AAC.3